MSDAAGDDRSRLLRALALSRRFHLFLAYCASPRAADQLLSSVERALPRLRKAPLTMVRLDPYEGRDSDAPLDDRELADAILIPLLSPSEERRAHGVLHVVDASRAAHGDSDAWARVFSLWNEKRNALQQLGGEVLVVLPRFLQRSFAMAAPDVWSIRSGEYLIEEEPAVDVLAAPGAPIVSCAAMMPLVSQPASAALGWYRAIPPLALFGGDLVVKPWLHDIVGGADVEDITEEETVYRGAVQHPRALAQRGLRSAEHALNQRRFDMAESFLRPTSADEGEDARIRRATALAVSLAAQDRVEEAQSVLDSTHAVPSKLLTEAQAYVHWCAGRLRLADEVDRDVWTRDVRDTYGATHRRPVERGEVSGEPKGWLADADRLFLRESFDQGLDALPMLEELHREPDPRTGTLTALFALARGDDTRSARLLGSMPDSPAFQRDPALMPRTLAFHGYVSALTEVALGRPQEALDTLSRARDQIAEWSKTGLDRRSLHRASLAVDLAHATLDPDLADPVGTLRRLAERAMALLGETAEDFVARVLAVEVYRELARRLAGQGDAEAATEAHRALDLARPLAGRGVPTWDAILAATEREAAALGR